ncbi:autophagy-related protein 13 isoform X2 [Carex rostrata]
MASSSETPATEQVITAIFAKSLLVILQSRSPFVSSRNYSHDQIPLSPSSSSGSPSTRSSGPRDNWFNLALHDYPAALENSDFWRQSNLEPLVIDILLVNRVSGTEKLLERWVVQYETRKQPSTGRKSKRTYYMGATLLFRSLYMLVRLLPAYNLFREINSSGRIRPLGLLHRIQPFVNPLSRLEEAEMRHLSLAPIETPSGRLSHWVSYLPVLDDFSIGSEPSTPLSTEFIPDYVGSPTTDPLKRFQALPLGSSTPICVQPGRRHSWSAARLGAPNLSPLPEAQKSNKGPEGCYPFLTSSPQKASLLRGDSELVRFGELITGTSLPKEISIGGDNTRYLVGVKFSLSLDLNEDTDANYPFAPDATNRTHNYEGERSQGAIVGALMRMLTTAPKLQIGFEKSNSLDQNPNPAPSGPRTAADALQELRNYMHMRDSILSQSGPHPSESCPDKEAKHKEETNPEKDMEEIKMP